MIILINEISVATAILVELGFALNVEEAEKKQKKFVQALIAN